MIEVARVRPNLFVGNAPQAAEDTALLAAEGVSAVLSLQTDDDLAQSGLRWPQVEAWYSQQDIVARRLPILDFSPEAIVTHMDEALAALNVLLEDGHTVYLHCTMGINRSPTIAIAYLVRTEGLSVAAALDAVLSARPAARPYARALETIRLWERAGDETPGAEPG
jgi:protein-tyrosine phosphatase